MFDIARSAPPEVVLARHGPFPVTANDFLSLCHGNWVTDQVHSLHIHRFITRFTQSVVCLLNMPVI